MTGRKPQLGHLQVFGCTAHAKNTTPNLKKLDDRSAPFVYLGVEEGSKAHRLYDPQRGRIVVSRDVIFEENVPWQWNDAASPSEPAEFIIEDSVDDVQATGPRQGNLAVEPTTPEHSAQDSFTRIMRSGGGRRNKIPPLRQAR